MKLTGLGFTNGMQVELRQAGKPTLDADAVTLVSSMELLVRFDLAGATTGAYDLFAIWPDTTTENLAGAFVISDGLGSRLEANLLVPNPFRRGRTYAGWLEYTNTGDADLSPPMFVISTDPPISLTTTCDTNRTIGSVQLLGLNSTVPTGMLPPGETHQIPFFFKASDIGTVSFNVEVLTGTTQLVDWASYKQIMQPSEMSAAEWDSLWPALVARLGTTWGDYVRVLQENATRFRARGETTNCIRDLLALEIQKVREEPVTAVTGQLLHAETYVPLTGVPVIAYGQNGAVIRQEVNPMCN